jgi:hypothetical protein
MILAPQVQLCHATPSLNLATASFDVSMDLGNRSNVRSPRPSPEQPRRQVLETMSVFCMECRIASIRPAQAWTRHQAHKPFVGARQRLHE